MDLVRLIFLVIVRLRDRLKVPVNTKPVRGYPHIPVAVPGKSKYRTTVSRGIDPVTHYPTVLTCHDDKTC